MTKPKANKFGRWFRMYDEVVDDPKVQTLGDKLGFFWVNCMCLASRNGGYLPPIDQIAWKLHKTVAQISSMVAALHEKGLLESDGDTYTPHNWDARQFCSDVSTERVRRFRERKGNVDETVSGRFMKRDVTVSETPSETDTETELETETDTEAETPVVCVPLAVVPSKPRVSAPAEFGVRFQEWFNGYLGRKAKPDDAARMWISVVTPENEAAVFDARDRYNASDEVRRGVSMEAWKFLYEQSANNWGGNWPAARDPPRVGQERSFMASIERTIGESIRKGEKPW